MSVLIPDATDARLSTPAEPIRPTPPPPAADDGTGRSARPSLMSGGGRGGDLKLPPIIVAIGCWQLVLASATIVATLLWWPLAEQAAIESVNLGWLTLTATTGMLLLGVAGGVAGSLVQSITIVGSRIGRGTLEVSYLWSYLLRPFGAALLALILVVALQSGLLAIGGDSGVTLAFVAGGLAGLFTDAVLQKLRGVLGATSTEINASDQRVPLAPPPTAPTAA